MEKQKILNILKEEFKDLMKLNENYLEAKDDSLTTAITFNYGRTDQIIEVYSMLKGISIEMTLKELNDE